MSRVLNPQGGRVGSRSAGPARAGMAACIVALIGVASGGQEVASKPAAPMQQAAEAVAPTFTRDVAPILQAKCQNCHRRHEAGPFALETYEQARKRAWDIVAVVEGGSMPPWKPERGVGPKLKHDLSLTPAEIATLGDWADAGAPPGDPKDMPPAPRFAEGWKQGPPDLELVPAEEFPIPASGPDLYRCFVLPTNLARDTYVTMIEFRPGNPRVVHHMQLFVDTTGAARQRDKEEKGPGYTSFSGPGIPVFEMMGFWNAGQDPLPLPPGVGLHLPRQADVILQVHYHPGGKPEVDRTRVGLHLARGPVKQALHWNGAQNQEFSLPAGESRIEVRASWNIPCDVEAIAVSPHMHMLGKDMRISVTYPNRGRTIDLISIPDWDPAWQGAYQFQEPVLLPRGSIVNVVAHFDNSAHERNPNQPPRPVSWGYSVSDEMCDGFLAVVKKGQDLTRSHAVDDLGEIFLKQRLNRLRRDLAKRPGERPKAKATPPATRPDR